MNALLNTVRAAAAAVCFLLIMQTGGTAQSDTDRRNCFSTGSDDYKDPKFYDVGFGACDRFIKSQKFSGKQLMPYVRQRADWLRRKREFDAALRDYAWAIELDPADSETYDFRGDVFAERGDYDRAVADYNTAIRLRPDYPPAYYARGLIYEKMGRVDDAVASYRTAASLRVPTNAESNTVRLYEWGISQSRRRLDELGR